jgi:F-type H+-transporting ATPase subunit epsilon
MKLQIITPAKLVKDVEVTSVTLPTASGEITVLPRHQPLLTLLNEGIVTYKSDGSPTDLAIGGGYAQTDGAMMRILVSRAYGQDEIDEKMTSEALDHAKKILVESIDSGERAEAQMILRRSIIDSKLIKRRQHSIGGTAL